MSDIPVDNDESDCRADQGSPCDTDLNCPNCSDYWNRMEQEGFWDAQNHRWTERGWREMMKEAVKDFKKNGINNIQNEHQEKKQRMFEGLAGQAQEPLPPEEAKKAEEAVKSFLERNPSGYTLSYGGNSMDDTAYVGFNKSNDYSGGKPEVVFQTPYKFKKDLHAVAYKVWNAHQDTEHSKKFPPQEINKEDALKRFDAASKHHDWYHDYSDDHRVWSAGNEQKKSISHAMQLAALVDPDGTKEVVKRNYPREFQDGAFKMIDHINANKSKWSKMYKLS